MKNFGDRQAIAITTLFVIAAGIPLLIGGVLLFVGFWIWSFQIRDWSWVHHTMFGWLTDWQQHPIHAGDTPQGRIVGSYETGTPKMFPLTYFVACLSLYLLYQVCEGVNWLVRQYANLARRNRAVVVKEKRPYYE